MVFPFPSSQPHSHFPNPMRFQTKHFLLPQILPYVTGVDPPADPAEAVFRLPFASGADLPWMVWTVLPWASTKVTLTPALKLYPGVATRMM